MQKCKTKKTVQDEGEHGNIQDEFILKAGNFRLNTD